MNSITPRALKQKIEQGEQILLIDVREESERAVCHIGGTLIPLAQVPARIAEIPRDGSVVVYCRSGVRSATAIEYLENQGYKNLQNLTGGILRWSDEVDSSVVKY
jgi:rhodanese-related sulfurtransferase